MTDLLAPAASHVPFPGPLPPPSSLPLAVRTAALNAWIEVDIGALEANLRRLRGETRPGVEVIAVVKANAYGAGVEGVAPALDAAGVERFAVVWAAEGLALRRLGITRPVLVLGHSFPEDAPGAVRHGLTLTCHSLALGEALSRAAVAQGRVARVHLHVDSGLHREGISAAEALALAPRLRALPGLEVEGLTTHMANADEPDDSFSDAQHARFDEALRELEWIPYRHTANSATALRRRAFQHEGVRLGLTLHGVLPDNTPAVPLTPVLSLKARLARVSDVPAGEGVSYGLTWRAGRPSRVALVPVGYADGWRRSLGNRGEVLVGGLRCPMVGRVMMDQFVVDVTHCPAAPLEGDECVLIGAQGGARIGAGEVAATAGTIPWDILASLQARLPRIFHRDGVVVPDATGQEPA